MRRNKRSVTVALFLALLLVLLTACQTTENDPVTDETTEAAEVDQTEAAATEEDSEASEQGDGLSFTPGSYEGEAEGFGGPIKVAVTVDEAAIQTVEVFEENETIGIGTKALELLSEDILAKQSIGVDMVSGCTYTSVGFLAAVTEALEQSGVNMDAARAVVEEEPVSTEVQTIETEIVIIGGGGSGMGAALTASEQGAKVVLLEKMPFLGGAMAISGGSVVGPTSDYQQAEGIEDSADLFYEDLLLNGHINDEQISRLYADNVGDMFNWLQNEVGVKFEGFTSAPEYQADRIGKLTGGSPEMAETIRNKLAETDVEVYLNTRATELIKEGDTIVGVKAEGADGSQYEIRAKATLLATGGFGNEKEMLQPPYDTALYYGPVSSTGDGHKMAMDVGAMTHNMEYGKIYPNGVEVSPGFAKSTVTASSEVLRNRSGILVDRSGKRVLDESGSYASIRDIMLEQEDQTLFILMDKENWDVFQQLNIDTRTLTNTEVERGISNEGAAPPLIATNSDIKTAAETVGVDGDALVETVENFNAYYEAGNDEEFGREIKMPIGEGPYYIIEQKPRFATTLGGLKITTNFEVLDENEQPIDGLFAVGEIVAGPQGDDSMPGANLGWAFTSGHLAGKQLAEKVAE